MPDENVESEEVAEAIEEATEEAEGGTVVVDLPDPEPVVVEAADAPETTVVVEEAPTVETATDAEVDRWVEVSERFGQIERRLDALVDSQVSAEVAAAEAVAEAQEAQETAESVETLVEAAEAEEAKEEDEETIEPSSSRVHPLFRSAADWRKARENK